MSAIMRRRRSLIGLLLIEGSCPEVGVLEPPILRTDARPVIVCRSVGYRDCAIRSARAQRTPARAVRSVTHSGPSRANQTQGDGNTPPYTTRWALPARSCFG